MTKKYQHTYKDGAKVTVVIEASDLGVSITVDPVVMQPHHMAEYEIFRDQVVIPDIMEHLTPAHMVLLAQMVANLAAAKRESA